jgi:hypothetical protein
MMVMSTVAIAFMGSGSNTARPPKRNNGSPEMEVLRWKSQRIKIHRLGYRFSTDFLIHTLGYGFLFGNHNPPPLHCCTCSVKRKIGIILPTVLGSPTPPPTFPYTFPLQSPLARKQKRSGSEFSISLDPE